MKNIYYHMNKLTANSLHDKMAWKESIDIRSRLAKQDKRISQVYEELRRQLRIEVENTIETGLL